MNPALKPPPAIGTRLETDSVELVVAESWPVQAFLKITATLPTPCHTVTVVSQDDGRAIWVTARLVEPPADTVCAQVLTPYETSTPLGSYSTNRRVLLNQLLVGSLGI